MSDKRAIAAMLAEQAESMAPVIARDDAFPDTMSERAAKLAVGAIVLQDPTETSKRVWAAVMALVTAILAVPEVSQLLGPWSPVVTAAISAALAVWSKASDPRPAR